MFRKSSIICAVVAMTLLMTSCGIPGKNDSEKEGTLDDGNYSFSEIETGIIVTSMNSDMSGDILYILGVDESDSSKTVMKTIDTKTFECSDFEQILVFDSTQSIHGFYPCADGYWVHASDFEDNAGSLYYLSEDFELISEFDVNDYADGGSYQIWDSTADGHLLISLGNTELFTLSPEGEKVQSWNMTSLAEVTTRDFYRAAVLENGIYCFNQNDDSMQAVKFRTNGEDGVEEHYLLPSLYNNCSVGEDGRIYLADLECNLYVINENGEPEFLFDLGRIKRRRPVFDLSVLGDGEYLAMFDCKVYSITKNPEDI